ETAEHVGQWRAADSDSTVGDDGDRDATNRDSAGYGNAGSIQLKVSRRKIPHCRDARLAAAVKIKGSGQECPHYTSLPAAVWLRFRSTTASRAASCSRMRCKAARSSCVASWNLRAAPIPMSKRTTSASSKTLVCSWEKVSFNSAP